MCVAVDPGVFLEEVPSTDAALQRAGTGGSEEQLSAVHELAGSLAAVGAFDAFRLAQGIEAELRQGTASDCSARLAALRRELAAVAEALRRELRRASMNGGDGLEP